MAADENQSQESTSKENQEYSIGEEPKEIATVGTTEEHTAANAEENPSLNQTNNEKNCTTSENKAKIEIGKETERTQSPSKNEIHNKNEKAQSTSTNENKSKIEMSKETERAQSLPRNEISNDNVKTKSAKEDKKIEKQQSRLSNYSENIKISSSSARLSDGKENPKEETLLSDPTTVVRFSPVWKQMLAASGPILLTFTSGLTSGYSAILLPQLKNGTGPIPYDENTASWIASMAALPMAPGCLISGYIMEKFGRRNSHYMISAPLLLGWILIACATNLPYMLAGRFFTGICVGLLGPLGPVYIAETSEPRLRGFFLAGVSLAIALGIFVAHLIGTFMTWQWTATISCLFPIIAVVLLTVVPESPSWLISKGKIEEGAKAFYWLRGYSVEAKIELKGIIDSKKASDSEPIPTWREKLANLRSPELIKPLLIMIIFFITCQFSGVNAVAFYSIEIVEKAVGKGIDHYLAMLLIDALRVVMSVVACVVCKQYGRRPLCMISGVWTAISMVGLSMFLYWKPENMVWLPLTCLMVYISAISIGLVPLPWIMCGEVFPLKVRGLGSGISSALTFAAFFVVVKTAPGMMTNFGEVITFLIYGVISLLGTAILYFILPETKGKSLQEIEERFKIGKRSSNHKV